MSTVSRSLQRMPSRWEKGVGSVIRHSLPRVAISVILLLVAAILVVPFLWTISSSLKDQTTIYATPPVWIPSPLVFDNFRTVWTAVPMGIFLVNSLKVASLVTLGQLLTCSMAAYAFARLRFPGRGIVFGVYLSSLLVPGQVTIIPLYILMKHLGLVDNHASLILPGLASAFGTFLLRQFFLSIPRELEEAAIVDGAGLWRVFVTLILPLARPALAALTIFTFNTTWNDFFNPLVFLDSPGNMTLPVGLYLLEGQYNQTSPAIMMAGVFIAVIPVLIVFLLAQRYIVEGITLTGLKG